MKYFSKLTPFVTVTANNEDCVVLRVKSGSNRALVELGYFFGDETQFRITKNQLRLSKTVATSAGHQALVNITVWQGADFREFSDVYVSGCHDIRWIDILLDCVCVDFGIYVGSNWTSESDRDYCRQRIKNTSRYQTPLDRYLDESGIDVDASWTTHGDRHYIDYLYMNGRKIAEWDKGRGLSAADTAAEHVLSVYRKDVLLGMLDGARTHKQSKFRFLPEYLRDDIIAPQESKYAGFSVGGYLAVTVAKELDPARYVVTIQDKQSGDLIQETVIDADKLQWRCSDSPDIELMRQLIPGIDTIGSETF